MKPRVVVSWSTGKDAAWCLHALRATGEAEVIGLFTTVTLAFRRVSVHGTRVDVLKAQANRLGLPIWAVDIPYPCNNGDYEAAMAEAVNGLVEEWAPTHVAFGDLFLEDVRTYREERLAPTPLDPLFPLWGRDTGALADEMLAEGLEAVIVAAQQESGAGPFVGRRWDAQTLGLLPTHIDPCGENGEFHTCVVGGPGFEPLPYELGETVERDGTRFCDLFIQEK